MKITVKGSTMVKPMQETPSGSVWLSSLDLVFPAFYTHSVNFFRSDGSANFFDSEMLKAALSRTLVEFYLCAGRLRKDNNGRLEIDCNGEGVMFIEAECDCAVDDLGGFSPRADVSLTPAVDYSNGISSFPPYLIQLTRFKCGGVSLGSASDHRVADGISGLHFYNTWSEIARGLTPAVPPSIDRRLLSSRDPPRLQFPHIEYHPPPRLKTPLHNSDNGASLSTFRLTADHIRALKKRCGSNYTTYEVVTGHAWRCATVARRLPRDQETKLQLPVDARRKLRPPLPTGFFGNGVFHTGALASCGELTSEPLGFAVAKVRSAIALLDDDEYLRSALDYVELNLWKVDGIVRSEGHVNCPNFTISSWVQLPAYEADFGWGKSVYFGPGEILSEGVGILIRDRQNAGSLLLLVTLHKRHINEFEKLLYADAHESSSFALSKI